ncbi:MAG TPA: hypothetical protein VMG82_22115 [Candidatus Sulfotelmatobacter sp.]|nr:hypothetical protein [Candidatus Sulfotelmatobacter sp.]
MDRREFANLAAATMASLSLPGTLAAMDSQAVKPTLDDANRVMEEAMRGTASAAAKGAEGPGFHSTTDSSRLQHGN